MGTFCSHSDCFVSHAAAWMSLQMPTDSCWFYLSLQMTIWKLLAVVAILLTTNLPTAVATGKPQCLSPVTAPFKACTLKFTAQQWSSKPMRCPSCGAQDTTISIIRAGNACGIVVNTTNNFLSAAACEMLLLTYPRNCEPSWVARAIFFIFLPTSLPVLMSFSLLFI